MNTIEKDSISSYEHLYSQTEETADHSQYPDDLNEELCITTGLNKCEAIIEDTIGHVDSLDNVGENSNANDNDDMMKRIEIDVRVSQNNDQLNDYGENCSAKHNYSKDVKTERCVWEVADDKNVTSFADMSYSNTSVRKSINSSRKNSKSKISALLRCRTFSYSRNNNNSAEPHSRPPSPISRRFRRLRDSLELAARSREIPIAHLPRSSTHVPYSRLRDSLELAARSRGIPVALLPSSTTHVPYSRLRDSLELARSRGVPTELSPHSTAHIPYSRLRDSLELAARSRGIPVALLPPSTTHVPYSRLRDSLELARSRGVPTGLSTHSTAHIPYGRLRDSLELAARSRGIPVALLPPSTTHVPYSRLRDSLELARSRGVPTGLSTHSTAHIPYGRLRDSLELARSSQLREPRYAPEYQVIENSPHSYRGSLEPVNIDISNRSLYASPRSSMSPYRSQHSLSRSSISMPSLRCRCRSISEQSMPSQYWLPRPLRRSSVPAGLLWPATSSPEQYRVRDLQTTDIVVPQEFEKQVSPFVTWDPDTSRWSRDFEDSLAEFWDKSKRIDVVGRGTSTRPASILREKSRGADRVHWRSSLAPEASFRFRRLSSPRQSTPSPHRSPRLRSSSPLAPRTSFRLRRSSSPRQSTPSPHRSPRLRSSSPLAPRTSFRLRRSSSPRRSTPSPYRSPRLRSSSPLAPRTSFRLRRSSSPRRSTPSPYRSPRLRSSSPLAPRTSFRLRHSSSSIRRAPSQYRLPSTRRSSSMPACHLWHTTSSPDKYRVRDLQTSDVVVPQELEQLSPIRAPSQDPLWSNASTPEHYRVRDFQTTNIIVDPQEFEKQVGPFVTWDPDTSRLSRDFEDSLEEFWENSYREDSRHKSPLVKYSSSNSLGPETSFDLSYILSPGRSTSSSSRSRTLDSSSPLGPETSFRLRRSSSSGRSIPSQYQLPSPRRSSSNSGRRIPSQYRLSRPLRSSSVPAGPLWSDASTPEQYRVRDFQTTNIRIDPQEFEQVSPFVTWDPDTSRWSRDFEDSLAELWNKPMRINVVGRGTSTKSAAILPEKSKGADGVSRGTYTRPASILREESIVTDGARRGTYTVPTSMLHRGTYTKPASILRDESNRSSSSYDSSASAEYKSQKILDINHH
ncbi:serine/arginine repetitive matrix protein 2-like [Octopus sinensis]|uniref:Serine/arginine repetitive matrix protein 2-like n=1 Tax=Octopus sinensis TaxID=2607531 RepID=A0A7E6EWA1_9MOLL|nr:serine/arginine repetitive matrix protein 2-like [Octopus sinensis]